MLQNFPQFVKSNYRQYLLAHYWETPCKSVAYVTCWQLEKYFLTDSRTNSRNKVNQDIRHCSCYAKFHYCIHKNQPLDPTEPDQFTPHPYTTSLLRQFLTLFCYGRIIRSLPPRICMHFMSPHARHTLGPPRPPWFHNLDGIRSRVQITKHVINRFTVCLPTDRQTLIWEWQKDK
jgi:hypothetical protein